MKINLSLIIYYFSDLYNISRDSYTHFFVTRLRCFCELIPTELTAEISVAEVKVNYVLVI